MSLVLCGRKLSEISFDPPKFNVELTRHCRSLHAANGEANPLHSPLLRRELVRQFIAKLQTKKPFQFKEICIRRFFPVLRRLHKAECGCFCTSFLPLILEPTNSNENESWSCLLRWPGKRVSFAVLPSTARKQSQNGHQIH